MTVLKKMIEKYRKALTTPGVWLGAAVIVVGSSLAIIAVMWTSPAPIDQNGRPAAVLTITPWDTSTPRPTVTTTISPAGMDAIPATLRPGEIGVGSLVQIVGTDGEGLNIRSAPGLASDVFFLGYDAEVFVVSDGPVEMDGFTWWFLVTPVDEARSGWAAADYLEVIENP